MQHSDNRRHPAKNRLRSPPVAAGRRGPAASDDDAAAEAHPAFIHHHRLARRHRPLRRGEGDLATLRVHLLDVASGIAFLRTYGLEKHFKFNIETNHATLAGHSFQHEIEVAAAQGMVGSIDANSGDLLLGWDTDQFNTDVKELTLAMTSILRAGGLGTGGFNFDAKLRRPSIDPEDLFHAHIGGMDAYALAFKLARQILADGKFERFVADRYASYDTGYGKDIERRRVGFRELNKLVLKKLGEPKPRSGKQEYLENILNTYLHR